MSNLLEPAVLQKSSRRRAPWRQRLVETERGITSGFRGDSTLFFYLFVDSALLAVGGVLDLSYFDWLFVALAVTLVLAAELLQQALRACVDEVRKLQPEGDWNRVLHLATAAVGVAFAGGALVIALIYGRRIHDMLS